MKNMLRICRDERPVSPQVVYPPPPTVDPVCERCGSAVGPEDQMTAESYLCSPCILQILRKDPPPR